MATISNNEIKIKYSLDTTDLANATALFDRLSAEDRQLLSDLKKLQTQLTQTGQAGETAGNGISKGNKAAAGSINDLREKVNKLQTQLNNMSPTANTYEAVLHRLKKAKDNLKTATDNVNRSLSDADKQIQVSRNNFDLLGTSVKQVGTYFATFFTVQALVSFAKQVIDTTIRMDGLRKAIEFTSGSLSAGLVNFEFLRKVTEELGLPLEAAAQGFKSMSAAAARANIPIEQQQQMFYDLSRAMAALQLTSADAQLVFFGFGQLMSKTKVSAQELYHQIGERLPIGMQAAQMAAAKITGEVSITSAELIKLVEDGKLLSSEFAPAFTEALGQIAGKAGNIETLGKSFTRLGNAWDDMLTAMGKSNEGFFYNTTKVFTALFKWIEDNIKGFQKSIDFEQTTAFENGLKKSKKLTNEQIEFRLMILEKQKEIAAEEVKTIQDRVDAQEFLNKNVGMGAGIVGSILGYSEEEFKADQTKLEDARLKLANLQGTVDAFNQTIKERKTPLVTNEDLSNTDAQIKLYKILIDRIESKKKAEQDRIIARTQPGDLRDIELLKNNIKFNKEMLKIDEDARFKELELAKNNATERKGQNERFLAEQEKIRIAAYERALKAEKEYIDKANKEIADGQTERRRMLQTEFDNEIADSQARQQQRIDEAVIGANKALKEQALSDEQRKGIAKNLQDTLTNIEREGQEERLAIEKYYARRAIYETKISVIDSNKIINEANRIRAVAMTTDLEKISDINRDAALNDIQLEKDKIQEQMKLNAEGTEAFVGETANKNRLLLAQLKLLEAQEIDIVKKAEQEKQNLRAAALQNYLSQIQAVVNAAFDLYSRNLNNEMVLMNRRYDEEIRLADGNKQKITEIEEKRRAEEKEIRLKQFRAEQVQAIANIWFAAAPQIVANTLNPILQGVIIGSALAQSAIVMAQPVPEFAEGTKGKPFKGGKAIVGERGVEKVVTESGKVYFTPPTATLVDLPKGSQVIPNHALNKQELFLANHYASKTNTSNSGPVVGEIRELGSILKGLPITQLNMDERGFEKFIRTPRRTTKVLNNRFGIKS